MDTLLQDLRYTLRSIAKRPGFAAVAVLTLALAIGANTAIFSVVDAVLLRALPYPAANRLAVMWGKSDTQSQLLVSVPDFLEWRAQNHSFEDIGIQRTQSVNLTGVDKPDRLIGDFVDAHAMHILGATTAVGRLFTDSETTIGSGRQVAVLSYAAWKARFGGDPKIVGRTLTLNGQPFEVIGVTASTFRDPYNGVEVYLPITSPPNPDWLTRDNPNVWGIGRLKPGVTLAAAQRDLQSIAETEARAYPKTNAGLSASVQSFHDAVVGSSRDFLLLTQGAVLFVLIIACANVANLLLARAAARQHEMSLRAALGAGRGRLVRQLLTESVALSLLGGGAGVLLASWGIEGLLAISPGGVPAYGPVGLDGQVLLFALGMTIGAGLLFGAAPAVFAAKVNLNDALTSRSADTTRGGRFDVRQLFVGVQLALCIVLLVGCALLARGLQKLTATSAGFDAHHVLTAEFRLPGATYRTPEQINQFMSRALAELRATPGFESAALVRSVPLSGNWGSVSYISDAHTGLDPQRAPVTQENDVSDDFFRTMGIPIIRGRAIDAGDRLGTLPVAVVNRTFAEKEWPHESPIGHQVHLVNSSDDVVTVVGEVGDVKQFTMSEPATPQLYRPTLQQPGIFNSIVARTTGDPDAMADQLRAAIWRIDADQPVWKIRSLQYLVDRDVAPPRFNLLLTVAFAGLALLLATVGVYGVTSYAVAQRTREVGIRMALGATAREVVGLVLGRGLRVVTVATLAGVAAAFGVARLMSSQLFGVSSTDPLSFIVAPVLLVLVAVIASYLPARRAARVDPMVALRND